MNNGWKSYLETAEFQEVFKKFLKETAAVVNPKNCLMGEEADYFLVPSELVLSLSETLNMMLKGLVNRNKNVSSDIDEVVDKGLAGPEEVPKNVQIVLGQLRGWGINLSNFAEVEAELTSLGDIDVLDWITANPDEYDAFLQRKSW